MVRIAFLAGAGLIASRPAARACGAGAVSRGVITVNAQRIFLSVKGGKTEIVVQLVVPRSPDEYGALIPLPAEPSLDSEPVAGAELDALDRATQVRIFEPSDGGGGCGCGNAADKGGVGGGVLVATVNIGPVTAATLRADSATAVGAWLDQNGFVIPAEQRPIVDLYTGAGRFFIAVKRNGAVADAPDSIGIHFTLDGDQRGLPLRFTRIGASAKLAFTVFVAAARAAGPSAPYGALLVTNLDRDLASADYGEAVAAAVAARGSMAFVAEYRGEVSPTSTLLGARLRTLVAEGQTLTRYSTILTSAAIAADADFAGDAPASVPTTIGARTAPAGKRPLGSAFVLAAVALAFIRGRR